MNALLKSLIVALGFLVAFFFALTIGERIEQILITDAEARLTLVHTVANLIVLIELVIILFAGWRLKRFLWVFIRR